MKRPARIVLALVLLLPLALLLRREPGEMKPSRPSRPAVVVGPPVEDPPASVRLSEPVKPSPARAKPAPAAAEEARPGAIRGVVRIGGVPPRRKKIRMDADPNCRKLYTGDILADDIIVDSANNLRWAFVYVARGNTACPAGPLPPVLLDQVGCKFEPRVLGVRVNQPVNIFNNDRLLHSVHALPLENKEFNFGLPEAGLFETKRFSRPEVMLKIVCDIHPWMKAWVGVLDHPYFSVTSETGNYGIVDLPPGRFLLKVWHEQYAAIEREVDVPPGGDLRVDFWLDARKSE